MATLVGIDIGSCYTKIVEIEGRQNLKPISTIIFKTPYLSIPDQAPQREIDAKTFWQEITKHIPLGRLKASTIAIAIPAPSIAIIYLLLPNMVRADLATAAITEAKRKMIPASGPNHVFEWLFLDERIVAKIPRAEISVIRAEKIYIQKLVDIFNEIENKPTLITPICCAIPNIIPRDIWSKSEDVAFVDLGIGSLNIVIYSKRKLVFARDVVYDFQNLVKYFADQLNLSEDMTENIIIEQGVPQIPYEPKDKGAIAEEIMHQKHKISQAISPNEKPEVNLLQLRMLWQFYIDKVTYELRRSLTYYKGQSEGRRVEQIYFLGGVSQIKNLTPALSTLIGGECKVIDKIVLAPIFAGATSLALSILVSDKKHAVINFLPIELKRKQLIVVKLLVLRVVGILLIFVFSLALANTLFSNHSLKMSIRQAEFKLSSIKNAVEQLKDLGQQENILQQQSSQIEEIIKGSFGLSTPLKELAKVVPPEILILQISIDKDKGLSVSSPQSIAMGDAQMMSGEISGSHRTSDTGATERKCQITIQAQVFADYEEANRIIEGFKHSLELTRCFRNIEVMPLKLEKISLEVIPGVGKDLRLTQPKARNFTLTAEVISK